MSFSIQQHIIIFIIIIITYMITSIYYAFI